MKVAMGHKKNSICKYFSRGLCNKGNFCLYKHDQSNVYINQQNSNRNTSNLKSNKQCRFWDNCFKYPNCGFKHYEVCRFNEKCYRQERCGYVHTANQDFLGPSQYRRTQL